MMNAVTSFYAEETGATSIEYALIASLISIVIIGALLAINDSQTGLFAYIRDEIVPALGGEVEE